MAKPEEPKRKKDTTSLLVVFVALIFFVYHAFRFINTAGNTHPLVDSIFNMALILGLIIILIHKKEFDEAKETLLKQSTLDKYFNSFK